MPLGMILGFIWFAMFVIGQWTLFHVFSIRRRSRVIGVLFSAALIACGLSASYLGRLSPSLWAQDHWIATTIEAFVTALCLFVLYMPFYYTVATSVSVRIIVRVHQAPARELPLASLMHEFGSLDSLRWRLDAMVQSKLLVGDEAKFGLTRRGRRLARLFNALNLLWRLGPGG